MLQRALQPQSANELLATSRSSAEQGNICDREIAAPPPLSWGRRGAEQCRRAETWSRGGSAEDSLREARCPSSQGCVEGTAEKMWQRGQRDPWIKGKTKPGMERTGQKHRDQSTHLKAPVPRGVLSLQDGPTHARHTEHLLASCDSIWGGSHPAWIPPTLCGWCRCLAHLQKLSKGSHVLGGANLIRGRQETAVPF